MVQNSLSNTIKLGVQVIFLCCMCVSLTACNSNKAQYENASRQAAEEVLEEEVEDDSSWTSVKTGKLKYIYTLHNEDMGEYVTVYGAEYDRKEVEEEEWLLIEVYMSEDELEVLYTECSYGDADTYEYDFADVPSMKNKDGLWINVNASEKEIKEAKEFYEDQ